MLKSLIKRTPLISIWRKLIRKREQQIILKFNRRYEKCITPYMDKSKLKDAMETWDNTDKKGAYVISLRLDKIGIWGYIDNILPHIAYAFANNLIPIIDMKNYPSLYQEENENAWETFFEQPDMVSLEDLNKYKIEYSPGWFWYRGLPNSCPLMSDAETGMWGTFFERFVRYNDRTKLYLQEEEQSILCHPDKTIAVIYRGTDYTQGHPYGHPIQPSMKMLADQVEIMMAKNGCEYIYLASDEKAIVDYMNGRFPNQVLINKRVYYDEATGVDYSNYNNDHIGIGGAVINRENNKYLIGIEYISSMNLVSKCSYLVAGACGGTTAVLYMNNLRYKEKYIFDLGKYGMDPIPEECLL